MKIYTKTGDKGTTKLFGGTSVYKNDLRIIAYGSVDELNSHLGLLLSHLNSNNTFVDIVKILLHIQEDLFIMGSDLANPAFSISARNDLRVNSKMIESLESCIDKFDSELDPLKSFILPGGSISSSICHVCRSICRRAESNIVALSLMCKINPETIIYMNRLSDLFFVLARLINKRQSISDITWRN